MIILYYLPHTENNYKLLSGTVLIETSFYVYFSHPIFIVVDFLKVNTKIKYNNYKLKLWSINIVKFGIIWNFHKLIGNSDIKNNTSVGELLEIVNRVIYFTDSRGNALSLQKKNNYRYCYDLNWVLNWHFLGITYSLSSEG